MDTQEEIVVTASRLRGPQQEKLFRTRAQATYSLPLEGMHPTMLGLFQARLKEQVLKSGGDMSKVWMSITDKEVIWRTGFQVSDMVFVSVGTNKAGQKCLTFDPYYTDEEIRAIAKSNGKQSSTPSVKTEKIASDATAGIEPDDAGF